MWIPIIGLFFGIGLGFVFPFQVPVIFSKYLSIAVLAAMDSIFGGLRSGLEDKYNNLIFITGFFSNAILAAVLAYLGDQLGVELYMAAIFVFGVRIFQNLAAIRRILVNKYVLFLRSKKNK